MAAMIQKNDAAQQQLKNYEEQFSKLQTSRNTVSFRIKKKVTMQNPPTK